MALKPPVRQQGYVTRGVLEDILKDFRREIEDGAIRAPVTGNPTGTGFRHMTDDIEDAAAKLVDTDDVNDHQITYAKIQNTNSTDVLLGRSSGGGGTVQEVPCTAAGRALIDDVSATAQRATLGLGPQPHIADAILGTEITTINLILDLLEANNLMTP